MAEKGTGTRLRTRLAISLLALVLTVGLAELGLRWFRPVAFRQPLAAVSKPHAWSGLFHRASDLPGLAYELSPGMSGEVKGMHVAIDSLGLRGPEVTLAKPSGVTRIAVLGDSLTFGFGVDEPQTFVRLLEGMLDAHTLGETQSFQTLNFGVGGYSSRDEAIVLAKKALAFEPDLVVVAYFLNDPETEPLQPLHQYFHRAEWWENSNVLRLCAQWKYENDKLRFGEGDAYRALHSTRGPKWHSVLAAFDSMRDAARERGVPVLLVVLPTFNGFDCFDEYPYRNIHGQVLEAARARGFDTLDLLPAFEATGRHAQDLAVDLEHPNAAGHAIVANALFDKVRERFGLALSCSELGRAERDDHGLARLDAVTPPKNLQVPLALRLPQ